MVLVEWVALAAGVAMMGTGIYAITGTPTKPRFPNFPAFPIVVMMIGLIAIPSTMALYHQWDFSHAILLSGSLYFIGCALYFYAIAPKLSSRIIAVIWGIVWLMIMVLLLWLGPTR
jgi:hypothetical protein